MSQEFNSRKIPTQARKRNTEQIQRNKEEGK